MILMLFEKSCAAMLHEWIIALQDQGELFTPFDSPSAALNSASVGGPNGASIL
jgi:hypothetical protein